MNTRENRGVRRLLLLVIYYVYEVTHSTQRSVSWDNFGS